MDFLRNLSPLQKRILTFGVPVVVALVLFGRRNEPAEEESTDETAAGTSTARATTPVVVGGGGAILPASDNAIGVGQLAEFESGVTAGLLGLADRIDAMATGAATPIAEEETTARYTAQMVRDLFARYGKRLDFSGSGETPEQGVERIVRDLNSGVRTWAQLEGSVRARPA